MFLLAFLAFLLAAFLTLAQEMAGFLAQVAPPQQSTYDLWLGALAVLTTIVSALILSLPAALNVWLKRGIVALVALILSAVGLHYQGLLDMQSIDRTWLLVFLGATALYKLLWQPITGALSNALSSDDRDSDSDDDTPSGLQPAWG